MYSSLALLLLCLVLEDAVIAQLERPLVTTQLGQLRGVWLTSEKGRRYAAFMTVPFAKPPIDARRFEPPEAVEAWHGVWDAGHLTPICKTYSHLLSPRDKIRIKGQEDCLYMNIYTPKLPSNEEQLKLPVLVFIHGGAFMFGGARYGGRYLMDRDVVLINISYRVGPLGFLSLGDDIVPGNNGMRDQVEALRWIQKHISVFGGDHNNVSLIGQSAGGASVHFHYLSPLSRGLFHRGISVSGTALCRWALADKAREKALQLAASVGCPTDDSRQILECLKSRPVDHIIQQVAQFQVWQYTPFSPFAPVLERPEQVSPPPFLSEAPVSALSRGAMLRAPWITGITTAEGLYPTASFISSDAELARLDREFELLAPHLLDFNMTVEPGHQAEVASRIRTEYFADRSVSSATATEVIKMVSDRLFVVDAQRAAELQASHSPVYFYVFNFRGQISLSDLMSGTTTDFGVSHADETLYYMNVTYLSAEVKREAMEKQIETLLLDLWSSFASSGVPEATEAPIWNPLRPGEQLEYLNITSVPPVMTQGIDLGNAKFWEALPFLENEQSLVQHNSTART